MIKKKNIAATVLSLALTGIVLSCPACASDTTSEAPSGTTSETTSNARSKSLVGVADDAEAEKETETETTPAPNITKPESSGGSSSSVTSNGHKVAIDPGHQGKGVDMSGEEPVGPGSSETKAKAASGTSGAYSGLDEYELNLQVSLLLKEELLDRGYEVVMTREDNDTAISNIERAQLAANEGAEILVRIHANGCDDHSVSGALAMVPSQENPYVGYLYNECYSLGEAVLNGYCESTGLGNLGVQYYDDMTGINWSTIPVTILEMGFMTNEHDDLTMADSSFWPTMAEGIANGIDAYFALS